MQTCSRSDSCSRLSGSRSFLLLKLFAASSYSSSLPVSPAMATIMFSPARRLWCESGTRFISVVSTAFESICRRRLCSAISGASCTLATTSPGTSTKSEVITSIASISRRASPAEKHGPFAISTWSRTVPSRRSRSLSWMYRLTSSLCEQQKMKISCMPPAARNSHVYSSMGTFTSGMSTLGCWKVTGRKLLANESASTTACILVSCRRSPSTGLGIGAGAARAIFAVQDRATTSAGMHFSGRRRRDR